MLILQFFSTGKATNEILLKKEHLTEYWSTSRMCCKQKKIVIFLILNKLICLLKLLRDKSFSIETFWWTGLFKFSLIFIFYIYSMFYQIKWKPIICVTVYLLICDTHPFKINYYSIGKGCLNSSKLVSKVIPAINFLERAPHLLKLYLLKIDWFKVPFHCTVI